MASEQGRSAGAAPTLYVLNLERSGAVVSVYGKGGATLLRSINVGAYQSVGFGVAPAGLLYIAANNANQANKVSVYAKRGSKLIRTFRQRDDRPFEFLTFDTSNDLYSTCGDVICEYSHGTNHLLRRIGKAGGPLATDIQGNLALSRCERFDAEACVVAPGLKQPFWAITQGINNSLQALAFDGSGTLYVDMNSSAYPWGAVEVYAPGASSPTRTISDGVTAPTSIALDANENLYVYGCTGALDSRGECEAPEGIVIYPPGGSQPTRVITQGVSGDRYNSGLPSGSGLALDLAGDLYVANYQSTSGGSVTVYAPGSDSPVRTITQGIDNPVAVAIGP